MKDGMKEWASLKNIWMISSSTSHFHTDPLSSRQEPHLFSTQIQHKNPSVQQTTEFNTPLSSTTQNRQFNTKNPSVQHTDSFLVLTDGCVVLTVLAVELRSVLDWGFFLLNWQILGKEKEWPFYVELRGMWNRGGKIFSDPFKNFKSLKK